MTRKAIKSTPLAAMLQTASLLAVAGAVFGILINDITRQRADVARVEAPPKVQLHALPSESDGSSR